AEDMGVVPRLRALVLHEHREWRGRDSPLGLGLPQPRLEPERAWITRTQRSRVEADVAVGVEAGQLDQDARRHVITAGGAQEPAVDVVGPPADMPKPGVVA